MFNLDFDNPLVVVVDGAARRAHAWAVLLVAIPAAVLAVTGGGVLASRFGAAVQPALGSLPVPWPDVAVEALFYVVIFGGLWVAALCGAAWERRSVWPSGPWPLRGFALGLALGGVGFVMAAAAAAAAGGVGHGGGLQGTRAAGGVLAGVGLIAFQAGGEEAFFRGWVQPVLCARWGPWLGLVATAIFFGALHLLAGASSPLAVLNLFLGGLFFGLLALRTGGLWAPFAAHFAWNWVEACGLGLEPNPGVGPTGAIVDLDLNGSAFWTGGADALNGSFASTLVLAALLVGLGFFSARRRSAGPISDSAPLAARRSDRVPS